jgi:tetratricopeptide (TPR) repeat protein
VLDEEFPLEFCRDLEALIRGIVGRVAVTVGAYEQAIEPLEGALEIAGESENAQIDALRLAKARAMAGLGETDAAIEFLRARIEHKTPRLSCYAGTHIC